MHILFFSGGGAKFVLMKMFCTHPVELLAPPLTGLWQLHSVRFISNDVIKRLVGQFQIFTAVAYFFPKIWNSRCLFSLAFFVILLIMKMQLTILILETKILG